MCERRSPEAKAILAALNALDEPISEAREKAEECLRGWRDVVAAAGGQ